MKPLQGSGGASVFLAGPGDKPNLNQMVEAITRDGYVVAQENSGRRRKTATCACS